MTDWIGKEISGFRIDSKIESPSNYLVFRATKLSTNQSAVLKILSSDLEQVNPDDRLRIKREADILADLNHPHIVNLMGRGESEYGYFVATQYMEGGNLRELLEKEGNRFNLEKVLKLLKPIGEALDFAHDRGVVHRDLKPENILLDSEKRTYVTDFDISFTASRSRITRTGTSIGTCEYLAPELWELGPESIDRQSDIYSLGIMLYEIMEGSQPFTGTPLQLMRAHIDKEIPIPENIEPDITRIIRKACAKNPHKRFFSVNDLIKALEQYSSNRKEKKKRRRKQFIDRLLIIAGIIATLLAADWVGELLSPPSQTDQVITPSPSVLASIIENEITPNSAPPITLSISPTLTPRPTATSIVSSSNTPTSTPTPLETLLSDLTITGNEESPIFIGVIDTELKANARVRAEPSIHSQILGARAAGEIVYVYEETEGWYRVHTDNSEWIWGDLIHQTDNLATATVIHEIVINYTLPPPTPIPTEIPSPTNSPTPYTSPPNNVHPSNGNSGNSPTNNNPPPDNPPSIVVPTATPISSPTPIPPTVPHQLDPEIVCRIGNGCDPGLCTIFLNQIGLSDKIENCDDPISDDTCNCLRSE
jgi:serine/threonine protein kinase